MCLVMMNVFGTINVFGNDFTVRSFGTIGVRGVITVWRGLARESESSARE
jgi:hypothetical protein